MTRATVRRDAAPPPAPPEPSPILLHAGVGSPGPRYSSAARLTPWLVGAVVLVVGLSIIDTLPVGALLDDGMYVILAKSLATGHGFRWLNVPGMPPATHFPPGYPALLALFWLLVPSFPANVLLFKAVNALLLAAAAVGMCVFLRRRCGLGPMSAGALAIVGSIGIPTLLLSSMVMSEPLFFALLIPVLLLAERVADGERRLAWLVALGLMAGAMTLVRSHGVALVAAVAIVLLVRRRPRDAAICFASSCAAILPWQFWTRAHQGVVPAPMRGLYESYVGWLARGYHDDGIALLFRTVQRTTSEISSMTSTLVASGMPPAARVIALVCLSVLVLLGLGRLWRAAPMTAAFIVFYLAVVIAWPYTPARFLWGIWPLVVALPALGAMTVWSWRPAAAGTGALRLSLLAATAFIAFGYARYNVNGYRGRWWSNIARGGARNVRGIVAWTRLNTRPTDVLMSNVEPTLYLYTNRQSLPVIGLKAQDYFRGASPPEIADAMRQILGAYRVDVVAIVGSGALADVARAMTAEQPATLMLRDSFPQGLAFTPTHR